MPTHLSAAVPGARKRGGGNWLGFVHIKRNADGTFAALTGTDCLGDTAGTLHILGTHVESQWARGADGAYTKDVTIIEMDLDHLNMMEALAPVTSQSILKDPDLTLEDGTQLVRSATSGDVTMPYFLIFSLGAPMAGKAYCRLQVAQFAPEAGWNEKITEWSQPKIKIKTVDANGYVAAIPASPPTQLSTFTVGATLAAPMQHGTWIIGT